MNKNKGVIGLGLIVAIVLGVVVVGGGAYYLGKSGSKPVAINPENILPNVEKKELPVVEDKKIIEEKTTVKTGCTSNSPSTIKLISPNGGETYTAGQKITIKWTSCNLAKDKLVYIGLTSESNGNKDTVTLSSSTENDGTEVVYLPNENIRLGNYHKVGVSHYYQTDASYFDNSDNLFTINSTPETYTYKNHGFTIELPKGYVPKEEQAEGGPAIMIKLPNNSGLNYITNATFWNDLVVREYKFIKDEKVGETTFKVYLYGNATLYYFKQGNVAYEFYGDKELLKTFKFVGWN